MSAVRSRSRNAPAGPSPFAVEAAPIERAKFVDPMGATSRMVVHCKGEPAPRVAACTLIS